MSEATLDILLVDDERIVHDTLGRHLGRLGHRVRHAYDGDAGVAAIQEEPPDVALVDVRMPKRDGLSLLAEAQRLAPDTAVVIITAHGDMDTVIEALRRGAADFLRKPVSLLDLEAVLTRLLQLQTLTRDRQRLQGNIRGIQGRDAAQVEAAGFLGQSAATEAVRAKIAEVAEVGWDTVLITGETGTGKEVVAREIHYKAGGPASPFVAVSCPALPGSLLERELFGHARGAFTDARTDQPGYFELADGGTLFLDEIGDLEAAAQAVLLRVLETRTFRRVGGTRDQAVSIQLLAATNAPLEEAVAEGRFRRDLYHRLDVLRIHIPPLRDRREDIPELAQHFLTAFAEPRRLTCRTLTAEAIRRLQGYEFPGNVRELRHLVERSAVLARHDDRVAAEHVLLPATTPPGAPQPPGQSEADRIRAALDACRWNRKKAAKQLGMPYSTLRHKIQKLGLQND